MASSRHYDRAVNFIRADQINERPDDGGCIRPAQRGQFGNVRAGAHPATAGMPLKPRRSPQRRIANSPTNAVELPGSGISIATDGIETVKQESGADHSPAGGVMKDTSGARP